jgi:sugar lactone lactonase YvrE
VAAKAKVGESPVWCAEEQVLYWVDILEPAIYRLNTITGNIQQWKMPAQIGSIGLCEQGGAIVVLRTGFHLFDFDTAKLTFIGNPESHLPMTRFNDGKVSPDGRFWVGTMDDRPDKEPVGALYRLDPDLTWHTCLTGLRGSNGLAWSPDGCTMYHSDSRLGAIHSYDYDLGTGTISNQTLFTEQTTISGRPDGAAVDVEGYYWSAGVSKGVLNRWSPTGQLDQQIPLPCIAPTMPCFGGPDLKTIYITSLTHNRLPEKLAAKPLSGSLFALEVEVSGVPIAKFKK